MTLGEKLLQLRQKSGLSQDKVAEMLKVSRQAVSKWERDEAIPDVDKIIGLSNLFNVTTDYILKEQPEEEQQKEERQQKREATHKPDLFQKVLSFIKEKWFDAGYVIGAWGIVDLIKVLVTRIILGTLVGNFTGLMTDSIGTDMVTSARMEVSNPVIDMGLDSVINTPMVILWEPLIIGILKIVAGILIVVLGKRYMKKRKMQRI